MSPALPHVLLRAGAASGLALTLIAGTAAAALAADREPAMAAQFVATINAERVTHGQAALATSSALTSAAARWVDTMSRRNVLAHNPNLAGEVRGWHYLGENVGVGYSVSSLETAFWESSEHRSNILDPHYTRIGVAVVDVGGKLWVAEEFERPYGASGAHPATSARARAPMAELSRSGVGIPFARAARTPRLQPEVGALSRCPREM